MREILNYMIEANIALLLLLILYLLILQRETHFRLMRFFMLSAIVISVAFPFIHLETARPIAIPAISQVVPVNWLPEITITESRIESESTAASTVNNIWQFAGWVYGTGVVLFFAWLVCQLINFMVAVKNVTAYKIDKFKIIESAEDKPTFSFFHVIYIGRANELSASEKEQIILHERVHAEQWHSLDILIVTVLGILFWFNPFIKIYKKIFIQLHEFEADARAVENSDVNKYCNLLARVALQSVHFPIASHFNNSLTVKRIEMMRTIKKTMRTWKIAAIAAIIPLTFFIIACQDQVNEIAESTVSQTGDYPPEIKAHMDAYMKEHPEAKLTYMDGLPEEVDKLINTPQVQPRIIYTYNLKKDGLLKKGVLLSDVTRYAESLQTEDKVFMVVEQMPEYVGGYEAMRDFIKQNMKYPDDAAKAGIGGTVYVSMVVNADGTLSHIKVLKGVEQTLDAEALRVVKLLPAWIPGKQNGQRVNVRFNMPIRFDPSSGSNPVPQSGISPDNYKMKVSTRTSVFSGKTIVEGTVIDENDRPLGGANIVIEGTTSGTTADSQGNFRIELPEGKKRLVLSFVGFGSKTISF